MESKKISNMDQELINIEQEGKQEGLKKLSSTLKEIEKGKNEIKEEKEFKKEENIKPIKTKKQKGKIVSIKAATVRVVTSNGEGVLLSKNMFINNKIGDMVEF